MPVLGADPDARTTITWEEDTGSYGSGFVRGSKQVRDLVYYFVYHPHTKMSQVINNDDRVILATTFNRLVKRGATVPSLKWMVDRFYQTKESGLDNPARVFASSKMLNKLLSEVDADSDDPATKWMLEGMPGTDQFPSSIRSAVLLHASTAIMRYPDVIASIVTACKDDNLSFYLRSFDELVRWNLGEIEELDRVRVRLLLSKVRIPEHLLRTKPAKGNVLPAYSTLREALLRVSTRRKLTEEEYIDELRNTPRVEE